MPLLLMVPRPKGGLEMNIKTLFFAYILVHLVHQPPALAQLFNGNSKATSNIEQLVESLQPGDVLVLGELHDNEKHHLNHEAILNELHAQGVTFDVGMEFFYDYRKQGLVDKYLTGELDDEQFQTQFGWGGDNFGFYKNKILWPLQVGGWTYAINAPRELTGAIAKNGLEGLSQHLKNLLPVNFQLGSQQYFDRFNKAVGGGHVPPEKLANYFAAQSAWDDTMAWRSLTAFEHSDSDIFVIVVGDFHVAYEDGLPERLRQRGARRVVTVSQLDVTGLGSKEKAFLLEPHPQWGQRAQWIWMTE